MDNDNKVEIKNPQEIHDKVKLFLGEELDSLHKSTVEQLYNIDAEYEKTKKNKSPFTIVALVFCFIVVFGIAFIMTKVISSKNKDIVVSVQEFDDLNLKGLLNTVATAQSNYDNAVKNKAILEADMEIKLKNAQETFDNDVFVLDSMNISDEKKYNGRLDELKLKYEETVRTVHEEYDGKIILADKEIQAYKAQLAEFDAAKVESAREQEKALDSERKVRELEEKRLTEKYEKRIAELNEKNTAMQRKHTEDIRNSVATVSQKYQAEIDTLDPKLKDEKANSIIFEKDMRPTADINLPVRNTDASEKLSNYLGNYQKIYNDYRYLADVVASIPQKYSIPKYVAAARRLVNDMGEAYYESTSNLYDETVRLTDRIHQMDIDFENERNHYKDEYKKQQAFYEASLESMMTVARTSAIVTYAESYERIEVYVTTKAAYLITDAGADAEIKADKTIKGKIFRNEEGNYYFEVGVDKEGNLLPVDFSAIQPGMSIKILSK